MKGERVTGSKAIQESPQAQGGQPELSDGEDQGHAGVEGRCLARLILTLRTVGVWALGEEDQRGWRVQSEKVVLVTGITEELH